MKIASLILTNQLEILFKIFKPCIRVHLVNNLNRKSENELESHIKSMIIWGRFVCSKILFIVDENKGWKYLYTYTIVVSKLSLSNSKVSSELLSSKKLKLQ